MDFHKRVLGLFKARESNLGAVKRIAVVAYPKSGQTWLRLLLGRYAQLIYQMKDLPLFDGSEIIGRSSERFKLEFTHAPLTWQTQSASDLTFENTILPFEDQLVVLLVRYPIDVLVSSYMQQRYRTSGIDQYTGTLEEFIYDEVFGIQKLFKFHELWVGVDQSKLPFLIRYEDLLVKPREEVERLLRFVGLPCDQARLIEAIEYASFESMKAMQANGKVPRYKSSGFSIFGDVKLDDPRSYHVRRGGSGHYRENLPAEFIAALETQIAHKMPAICGYATPPVAREAR